MTAALLLVAAVLLIAFGGLMAAIDAALSVTSRADLAELGAKVVELTALVVVAEAGGAGEQLVLDQNLRTAAELRVEGAQQRVLAPRGGGEIGCAVDDAVVASIG